MARNVKMKTGFTLGGEQAEADAYSEEAFVETGIYNVIEDRDDPRCFLVGRTGSGKSAALQHLEEVHDGHVIRITPENLSLPYITNLQAVRTLDDLDVNLDPFWIALWKHVLLVEIIRHRYRVSNLETKQRFLASLRDRINRDPTKVAALEYLDEFDGKFWCETDERVREITDKFSERITAEGGAGVSVPPAKYVLSGSKGTEVSKETRSEITNRFQRIVNESQVAKLNKMVAVLDEEILDTPQHFTYVVIDDLDRDWVDERVANDLVRCLFRTVLEMQRVKNLKILVALRTNIFQELDFGKRSAGQEEKFRALVLEMQWTRAGLVEVLDQRARVASGRADLGLRTIQDFLPPANRARGNPVDYILDRTLLRPRDAIAYSNECLRLAAGKHRVTWPEITTAERAYSTKRLLALRDEWKTTYPGIEQVLQKFSGSPGRMAREEFQHRLDDALLLLSDAQFPGTVWMTDMSRNVWAAGDSSWFEMYHLVSSLLYSIGFLGCAKVASGSPIFFMDDPHLLDNETTVDRLQFFHIHRMFHSALDVKLGREASNLGSR